MEACGYLRGTHSITQTPLHPFTIHTKTSLLFGGLWPSTRNTFHHPKTPTPVYHPHQNIALDWRLVVIYEEHIPTPKVPTTHFSVNLVCHSLSHQAPLPSTPPTPQTHGGCGRRDMLKLPRNLPNKTGMCSAFVELWQSGTPSLHDCWLLSYISQRRCVEGTCLAVWQGCGYPLCATRLH